MAIAKVRLSPKKQKWRDQFKVGAIRGKTLRVAVSIEQRYAAALSLQIDKMVKETEREVLALFGAFGFDGSEGVAMDASIASQARILTNALSAKFDALFARVAAPIAYTMVDQIAKNSESTLKSSLRELSDNMSFKTDVLTGPLNEVLTATVAENVGLIKRVPQKYLNDIQGMVMRSIQTGDVNLQEELGKYNVSIRNWSKNVALDQTRKAYNGINKGRMQALGLKKFEWIHSQGSNRPREFHKNVLNGEVFSFDDLPIIDKRTGERGIPGQLPYCRCTMRPIMEFDDDED